MGKLFSINQLETLKPQNFKSHSVSTKTETNSSISSIKHQNMQQIQNWEEKNTAKDNSH